MPDQQSMEHLDPSAPIPEGFDLIQAQRHLQDRLVGKFPSRYMDFDAARRAKTYGELLACVRFNKEAIDNEHAEILDRLPWKRWKQSSSIQAEAFISTVDRQEIMFELIDEMHFLLNMMIVAGFSSWDEVERYYYSKLKENNARQDRDY